jgi:YfaZ precursor
MYSRLSLLIAAPLLLAATQALAQRDTSGGSTAEFALSNDTLQLRYLGSGSMVGVQGSQFTGGVFLGEERDLVMSAGLLFPADLGIRRLSISFGPQAYAALLQEENDDVMAISVGTEVRFFIDPSRRLAVSGQAYYAPDILTFGAADNLTDLSARVELRVAEQLQAFGGMRWFEFDLTDGSGKRTLQQEAFFGIGYRF